MGELRAIVTLVSELPSDSRPRSSLSSWSALLRAAEQRLSSGDDAGNIKIFGTPAGSELSIDEKPDELDSLAMIGWQTRLVRRLKSGYQERGIPPVRTQSGNFGASSLLFGTPMSGNNLVDQAARSYSEHVRAPDVTQPSDLTSHIDTGGSSNMQSTNFDAADLSTLFNGDDFLNVGNLQLHCTHTS